MAHADHQQHHDKNDQPRKGLDQAFHQMLSTILSDMGPTSE